MVSKRRSDNLEFFVILWFNRLDILYVQCTINFTFSCDALWTGGSEVGPILYSRDHSAKQVKVLVGPNQSHYIS